MRRRDLLAVNMTAAAAAAPPSGGSSDASTNVAGVGLPVISQGRVRNYIFVVLRLVLAPNTDMAAVRAREPFLRDALVRHAHRSPLPTASDGLTFEPQALIGAVTRMAPDLVGRGLITSVEVVSQAARRRTIVRSS